MKIERMLVVVIVLQLMVLASQWVGQPMIPAAHAQNFNPVERQLAILDEAKSTNTKLDKLIAVLQSGDVQVKVVKDEEKK